MHARSSQLFAVLLVGCGSPGGSGGRTPDMARPRQEVRVGQNLKNQLDLLFMVDNSNSIGPAQGELRGRFPLLAQAFVDLAAAGAPIDLQLGVVTSDYGAGITGAPGCQPSPGGQQGRLQGIGAVAPISCRRPVGSNFVKYDFAAGGQNNLPPGQDLVTTFTCMSSVGENGCGFEHPLESVYAAFQNRLAENTGFLRDGALLAVVFLTDEDDSSAPPDSDLFDKNRAAQYGYESSYRSVRYGIVCGYPSTLPPYGDSGGPLSDCRPAPNPMGQGPGKEHDVSRYVDLFTQPALRGGLKVDPRDVILVGITAPEEPVQVILSNPGTPGGQPFVQCPQLNEASIPPCVPVVQHSCQNPYQPVFFGDPAVRLNAVVRAASSHALFSVCETDDSAAYAGLGRLIALQLGAGCLAQPLPDPAHPDCTVESVDAGGTRTAIPQCAERPAFPCWKVDTSPVCAALPSLPGVALTVERNGVPPPPGTTTEASCARAP